MTRVEADAPTLVAKGDSAASSAAAANIILMHDIMNGNAWPRELAMARARKKLPELLAVALVTAFLKGWTLLWDHRLFRLLLSAAPPADPRG